MIRLKKSQLIFNNLCLAAIELNHVYSYPALFIISSKLISILYGLFSFIHGMMYPTILMEKAFFMGPFSILMDSIMIYCYLNAADTLAYQVILEYTHFTVKIYAHKLPFIYIVCLFMCRLDCSAKTLFLYQIQKCNPTWIIQ